MTVNHRVRIPEDVIHQKVGEEIVLLNLETGIYYGLDPVGTRLWELLLEHRSLQPLFEIMLREYEVSPEELHRDIEQLIEELQERALLQFVG